MPKLIREAPNGTIAASTEQGRYLVQLINPGWGSSGYYSPEVLEAAGKARVFPKGTQMMIDHQTEQEWYDKPAGSIRDLAAVLDEDARWDDALQALVAEARVFSSYRPLLDDMAADIGVSIRAFSEGHQAEAEGRKGWIVDALVEGVTVDFVTRAGRGGKVLEVMESAMRDRAQEASANDRRDQLERAMPDRSWVRDFDETDRWVVFTSYDANTDRSTIWRQTFEVADDDTTTQLTGTPEEVRPVTTYVPVTSAGQTGVQEATGSDRATHQKETNVVDIDPAELEALKTKAAKADTLQEQLNRHEAENAATARAGDKLKESKLPQRVQARLTREAVTRLPLKDGRLDETAFDQAFDAAVTDAEAEVAEITPAGGVTGFGASAPVATESERPRRTHTAFGRKIEEN